MAKLAATCAILLFMCCILTNSALSLRYASLGLELWFSKMIPALLPFMILSGILVRLELTEKLASALYPVLRPLYRIRRNVCYCMMLGFLCGFPMGARVTAELYERDRLTEAEAEYLLAFCNNIGPVYFCSFALPLLGRKLLLPYLFGMYGIPLLYGLLLRYTLFRDRLAGEKSKRAMTLCCCEKAVCKTGRLQRVFTATNESVAAAVQGILQLGGYMILFNVANLIPHCLVGRPFPMLAPLLEITGGLIQMEGKVPLFCLLAITFGGVSCIAQTYSCIADTKLSLCHYIVHKTILTLFTGGFYLCWFLLSPGSFLR